MTTKLFLFTNARDEPHIVEWAIHHILLGFTHVFIFDHMSIEPIRIQMDAYRLAHPEHHNITSRIYVMDIRTKNGDPVINGTCIKLYLMERARQFSQRHLATWMMYLDADEFIYLSADKYPITDEKDSQLLQLVRQYDCADAISLNWLLFGTSQYNTQPEGLLMNHFIQCAPSLNKHVKTLVRPMAVARATNPHLYPPLRPNRCISATTGNRRDPSPFDISACNIPRTRTPAYIAHYAIQSKAEYVRRRSRCRDDNSGSNLMANINAIHSLNNDTTNIQLRALYGPTVAKFFL